MNKNQLVKFSLSLVCASVLAACSSGGSGGGNAAVQPSTQQTAQQLEAAKKAAEEAAKKAAEEAAAKKAEEARQAALNKSNNRQGAKFVKKEASDFEIGLSENGHTTSTSQGNASDMTLKLHRSLDTVVVATNTATTAQTNKIGYLEDYDFRKSQEGLDEARTNGATALSHINIDGADEVARTRVVNGEERRVNGATAIEEESIRIRNHTADTKTDTKGAETGTAFVYQTGRNNYIGADERVVGSNSEFIVREAHRDRKDTVTEVYGHRTFVLGNAETGEDATTAGNDAGVNAPFQHLGGVNKASGTYAAGQLNKVQYGRVTSQLHFADSETTNGAVKNGVSPSGNGTLVVRYGHYGKTGTENNYFYRGVDATAKADAAKLAELTNHYGEVANAAVKAGTLAYQGHAVTYGIEHKAPALSLPDTSRVPNALYGQAAYDIPVLVSGTHVAANIDLATRAVTGNLYDVWALGYKNKVDGQIEITENTRSAQDIATFSGVLANSGEIDGTSVRTQDNASGSFNANLYGAKAEELGGAIASNATDAANSWGAVFGATIQNPVLNAVTPVSRSPWSVQTDEANK